MAVTAICRLSRVRLREERNTPSVVAVNKIQMAANAATMPNTCQLIRVEII